ncbi:OmpA family protein [Lacibacterium aquatile]|uniref:OmpA family protein n=1 Tax=Lacibacterium aquatile TaxID=1168082 RepID=A0ABW5DRJ4_9PROT
MRGVNGRAAVIATALALGLAACSDSDSPSAGAKVSDQQPTPSVNSVPARPTFRQDSAGRQATAQSLSGDRSNARYTEEVIRRNPQVPVPATPLATVGPEGVTVQPGFPPTPAPAGSAPVSRVVPSSQSPLTPSSGAPRQADPSAPPPAPTDMGVPQGQPGLSSAPIVSQPLGTPVSASAAPSGQSIDDRLNAMLADAYQRPATATAAVASTDGGVTLGGGVEPAAAGVSSRVATLYFADGSANIDTAGRTVLRDVARIHLDRGGMIRIVGHASRRAGTLDPVKRETSNLAVSASRADAVTRLLRGLGVSNDAMIAEAVSDAEATFDEASPAGEAANRRVEIYLEY